MPRLLSDPRVTAVLGPTNTGKTHRAIQAMLEQPSGMIGLPLRLLAREVYDRVVAARGEAAVALVTGEEKRIPADPRYFVCTVEAMPVDRPVAFLAVDEFLFATDGEALPTALAAFRGWPGLGINRLLYGPAEGGAGLNRGPEGAPPLLDFPAGVAEPPQTPA